MKARLILCALATTIMFFAGCGKDDPEHDNNVEMVGTTWVGYHGNPQTDDNYATYTLVFNSNNSCTMSIAFYASSEGGNYATTNFSGTYSLDGNNGNLTLTDDILHEGYNDSFTIDGDVLTLTHNHISITMIKSNGGDTPNPELTQNGLIIDGHPYPAEVTATYNAHANLSYEFRLSNQNENPISICVEIEPSAIGYSIGLTLPTTAYKYRVTIYFWDEEITATQDAFTGTVSSSYWDIAAQTDHPEDGCIFTSGTLYTDEDNNSISMTLTGELTNGHSISARMRINKSEISDQT